MKTYLIPGLGGDKRMYEGQLKNFPNTIVLEFIEPHKNESIASYAHRLAAKIDTSQDFVLLGVSLGGIIAQEIAKLYQPKKVILISTVKTRKELPLWMRFFSYVPLQKMVPGKMYLWAFMVLVSIKTIFTRSNNVIARLKDMAKDANPIFVSWAVNEVVNWQNPLKEFQSFRIHGNKDFLFPLRKCKEVDVIINGGTHAMILTHVKEINQSLADQL